LCAALAFALAFAPSRVRAPALVVLAVVALLFNRVSFPEGWHETIFAGCWISVIIAALSVHVRAIASLTPALLLAANTGVWAGAVIAIAGTPQDLTRALPVALLALPAGWIVANRAGIAIKVLASWLVAVAILVAALPIVPTPGYVQDHME
jgi:hypothetical protein